MSSVQPGRAAALTFGIVVKQLVTRGRLVGLTFVGAAIALVAFLIGRADIDGNDVDVLERGVRLISLLGFGLLVPIVSLVFASAALGDMREDGTLVYLWLRPMDRWPVVVGAWGAAVAVSLPVTLVPLAASAILVDVGSELVVATVLAAVVGTVVYSALFVLAGLLVKNAIVWGLLYILFWEGFVAAFGGLAAKLAIVGYTRSIITDRTGVDLELGDLSLASAVVVPLLVTVALLTLASVRLRSMEVA
jgi:ABC-2 type transport system permease protein